MLHPHQHSDSWREALKIINRCPICSENYNPEAAKIFAKNETASMVHITCQNCQSYFMAMVVMFGQGLSSVGMVTDLNFTDAERLHKFSPITVDEMIEGYKAINATIFTHSLV